MIADTIESMNRNIEFSTVLLENAVPGIEQLFTTRQQMQTNPSVDTTVSTSRKKVLLDTTVSTSRKNVLLDPSPPERSKNRIPAFSIIPHHWS